jgi:hypothetical protein
MAEEYDHGGLPSFRVRGRPRFASGLDEHAISLVAGEEAIREAVAEWPETCKESWHGPKLVAVRVAYPQMPDEVVIELVTESWAHRAPVRVVRQYRADHA